MAAPLRWFPFDIDAWDTDEVVRRMSMAERGVYLSLLCWQWREGSVPQDPKSVAKALGSSRRLVAGVLTKAFIPEAADSQRLINRHLAEVYVNQLAKSERASNAGRASAARRVGVPSDRSRSRSRIRSEIQKSLSSTDEKAKGNGELPIAKPVA